MVPMSQTERVLVVVSARFSQGVGLTLRRFTPGDIEPQGAWNIKGCDGLILLRILIVGSSCGEIENRAGEQLNDSLQTLFRGEVVLLLAQGGFKLGLSGHGDQCQGEAGAVVFIGMGQLQSSQPDAPSPAQQRQQR